MLNDKIKKEIMDNLVKCTQCNLCILGCPMFIGSRFDHYSPRTIVVLSRAMLDNNLKIKNALEFLIFLCNNCKNCEIRCPSKIPIADIISTLKRHILSENVK